jgi:omega-amidase
MKVAGVQHDVVWEDRAATLRHLEPLVGTAAAAGARLVVLTEMFPTGFSMEPARVAEPEAGPTTDFLLRRAAAEGVWLCGSVAIWPAGTDPVAPGVRAVNRFLLAGPGGSLAVYDKLHPFTYAGEHQHYAPGTQRGILLDVEGLRVAPFVCYDLRFADEFWDLAPAVDCYVVVANWPAARRAHWQALLVARAIENQAYVVGVNRVGEGGGVAYAGDSRVVAPSGEVLAGAAEIETVLLAEVDPAVVARTRARYPFLADRRELRPPGWPPPT